MLSDLVKVLGSGGFGGAYLVQNEGCVGFVDLWRPSTALGRVNMVIAQLGALSIATVVGLRNIALDLASTNTDAGTPAVNIVGPHSECADNEQCHSLCSICGPSMLLYETASCPPTSR